MVQVDLAVIGGGPAGACAALAAARGGLRVLVIEKGHPPRHKTCGGGLVARARALLPEAVTAVIHRECFRAEMGLSSGAGRTHRVACDAPIVSMLMRDAFDAALLDEAVRAGAEVRAGVAVTGIERHANGVAVHAGRDILQAAFVLIADGASGRSAALAGWTGRVETIPALELEVPVTSATLARFDGVARFDFGAIRRGYGWVFPKREHLSVGVLSTDAHRPALARHAAQYMDTLGIEPAGPVERHGYVIPSRPRPEPLARDRVLLAGDAAGLADPITFEGISHAVMSGQAAARALIVGDVRPGDVEAIYQQELAAGILADLAAARSLARFVYSGAARWAGMSASLTRRATGFMADVMRGRRRYADLSARSLNPPRPAASASATHPSCTDRA